MTNRHTLRSPRCWFHALIAFFASIFALVSVVEAGWIEERDGETIIHVEAWTLPDPSRTDTATRAKVAVLKAFIEKFPQVFAERYREQYRSNPQKYGSYNWDQISVEMHRFTGISIEGMGMDSGPLMAIAGGVSPDILYVNFRQSDTYIQEGFLYPLDKPEDGYVSSLDPESWAFRVHPKVEPVIRRKGTSGKKQVWALPSGGVLGKVMLYRKDLLDRYGVPYPHNDWTWDDLYEACRKVTNPQVGTYGIQFGRGRDESFHWVTYLWSAGGEVMEQDPETGDWSAVFDSPEAAVALDFYTRLCTEPWEDAAGRIRYGYAAKDASQIGQKWSLGQIAFRASYIDEQVFATINPDTTGMVPVPIGPTGLRGGEINARMQGLFSGIESPVVRDAAWEYLRFVSSREAVEIHTRVMVEGGLGRFVNPRYLRTFGYEDIVRLAPQGWEECFEIAISSGKPEPYGKNCQLIYSMMTKPLVEAEGLAMDGGLPSDRDERLAVLQQLLKHAVAETEQKMIGKIPPGELRLRRWVSCLVLAMLGIAFGFLFRRVIRAFQPPSSKLVSQRHRWGFKKYRWGYFLLLPAVLSIFIWQYIPLGLGSKMAFQDYRIMGENLWVGVDNFGHVLWDQNWWAAVWNSIRYSVLVVSLTFLPPVILAVLLDEIPQGKILFRTLFYLPAVITGLVVIYLWRSFYDNTEFGVLNALVMKIPAIGYFAVGLLLFWLLFSFARRLYVHDSYVTSALCLLVGGVMFFFLGGFAWPIITRGDVPWYHAPFQTIAQPYRWLENPQTAMLSCVLPMVWAGMGPGCLIYLAALKGVSPDYYEAADIDGATFIDKILFIVIPILKPLLIIQFVGVFINSWKSSAFILAMTGGASNTTVAGLHIFYQAYLHLKFGPATAMAWLLGFMLIGFTVHQLRILSRLEFKTTGK